MQEAKPNHPINRLIKRTMQGSPHEVGRALDADQPPLRLVLGADAIANIEGRLEGLSSELAAWREVGRATALNQGD